MTTNPKWRRIHPDVVTEGPNHGKFTNQSNEEENMNNIVEGLSQGKIRDRSDKEVIIGEIEDLRHQFLDTMANLVESANAKWLLDGLKEADAQSMVDFLNKLLNEKELLTPEKQKNMLYFLTRLAKTAQVFPKSLELANVQCDLSSDPVHEGGFGLIYRGDCEGRVVCIKAIHVHLRKDKLEKAARAQARELIIWAHVKHSNILPFYGFYLSDEKPQRVCIITPWMENGNLSAFLKVDFEMSRILLLYDVLSGLNYLHGLDIVHGDLKAANILISETKRAMIADFGISRVSTDLTKAETLIGAGTLNWQAPELFDDQPPTRASDIWAFGCIIHEVLTGKTPFDQFKSRIAFIAALVTEKAKCEKPSQSWSAPEEATWKLGEQCRTYISGRRPQTDALLRSIDGLDIVDHRSPVVEMWKPRNASTQVEYSRALPILCQIQCFISLRRILMLKMGSERLVELVGADAKSVSIYLSKLLRDKDTPLLKDEKLSILSLFSELAPTYMVLGSITMPNGLNGRLTGPELTEAQKVDPSIDYGRLYKVLDRVQRAVCRLGYERYSPRRRQDMAKGWSSDDADFLSFSHEAYEEHSAARRGQNPTLETLAGAGMLSALLNSAERAHAPRCHKDTRRTLRTRTVEWGRDEGHIQPLLWLSGPTGIGKTAVAQTVAEELKKEGLLGAVFFFSRKDPWVSRRVIPTLVYQLALLLPEYQRIITQRLATDTLVLSSSLRSQFEELIAIPFLTLITQHPAVFRPLVIVIDGLDECGGYEVQCEFIDMISQFTGTEGGSRLRWIICSRPERRLQVAFSDAICLREKLEVNTTEAQEDAVRILVHGFTKIRQKYLLPEDWPNQNDNCRIADQASGHLGFVSSIIRFIGDDSQNDPVGRLNACIQFLEGTGGPRDPNPLRDLDLLYTQILSTLPRRVLRVTIHYILGVPIIYGSDCPTALVLANFLGFDSSSFYDILGPLYSVLSVPPESEASTKPIQIYHPSFSDYLSNPVRSERLVLNVRTVHAVVVASGLRWLRYCHKGLGAQPDQDALMRLSWVPPQMDRKSLLDSLYKFSFASLWKACTRILKDSLGALIEELEHFDFNLAYSTWPDQTREFAYFIRWLISLDTNHGSLVIVDRCHTGRGDSAIQGEISIRHRDNDPDVFVAPFFKSVQRADTYSFHLRLGRHNPAAFWLLISSDVSPGFVDIVSQ